jgi:hypothetical protein
MSISGPSAPAVRSNVVNRAATGSSVTVARSNRAASQVRAIVAADPVVDSDLNVVNERGEVSGHSRKLGSLAEFYEAVSECTISGNMYMSRFEFLEMNLHLYDNDKKQFLDDRDNIMDAILKGYAKTVVFRSGVEMKEWEVVELYGVQKGLKANKRHADYTAILNSRKLIVDKVYQRFKSYTLRLFPTLTDDSVASTVAVRESTVVGAIADLAISGVGEDGVEDEGASANIPLTGASDDSTTRKRKATDRFTISPGVFAKSGSSKKRVKIPSRAFEKTFVYLDQSEDDALPVVPENIMNRLKSFMQRISPDEYVDVIKMLESHAVSATPVRRSP